MRESELHWPELPNGTYKISLGRELLLRPGAWTAALHTPNTPFPPYKMLFSSLLGTLSILLISGATAAQEMRVSTYNLRYDSMPNNITVQQSLASLPDPLQQIDYYALSGEQPWSTRRIKVYQHLNNEGPVVSSTCPFDHARNED